MVKATNNPQEAKCIICQRVFKIGYMGVVVGWSENNFFFEIEKSVVLKTCQTGKIYEKNWFWRVATFGGLANPQNVF